MSTRGNDSCKGPAAAMRRRPSPWLAALAAAAGICSPPASAASDACELDIVGRWASDDGSRYDRIVLDFGEDGWVTLLQGRTDRPVREYEMLGAVEYELAENEVIFSSRRGIEMFPRGSSGWIIDGDDERFTAHASGSDRATLWTRVRTQRYFVTFAAREAETGHGPAAFVMWTEIDDRRTRHRAVGAYVNARQDEEADVRFGRIPSPLIDDFATESDDDSDVMLRLELDEPGFRRAIEIYEAWDVLLKNDLLAEEDPYLHAAELVSGTVQAANRCGTIVAYDHERFGEAIRRPRAYALAVEGSLALRQAELIRHLETVNRRYHVEDEDLEERTTP